MISLNIYRVLASTECPMYHDTKISFFPKNLQDFVAKEDNRNRNDVPKWWRDEGVMYSLTETLIQRFLGVGKIRAGL